MVPKIYFVLSVVLGLFLANCTSDSTKNTVGVPYVIPRLALTGQSNQWSPVNFKLGDIVFQSSHGVQSTAVALATHSNLTHCGLIIPTDTGIVVFEAVQPVKMTKWEDWKERGMNKAFSIYRLKQPFDVDEKDARRRLVDFSMNTLGKNYDLGFMWDDDAYYCSELVWKCYKICFEQTIGGLKVLGDYDLTNPLVKTIMEERYGADIPLDEPMIAPISLAQDKMLVKIGGNLEEKLLN